MATFSSHLLNSVDGTHASGVKVIINQINSSGDKKIFFETETHVGGRILKDFDSEICEFLMEQMSYKGIKIIPFGEINTPSLKQ